MYLPLEISWRNQTLLQSINLVFCFRAKNPAFYTKTTKNNQLDTKSLFELKNQMKNIDVYAIGNYLKCFL
jgi:hypothetical protein